jgi:hypothetical protein
LSAPPSDGYGRKEKRDDGHWHYGKPKKTEHYYGGKQCSSNDLKISYENGVLKVSGLDKQTGKGAFESDLSLCFGW